MVICTDQLFFLNPNKILFVIKITKIFKSLKILRKFKIFSLKSHIKNYSTNEISLLKKLYSNLIIIDRLGKVTKNFNRSLRNNFKKKIIFDDSSKERRFFDLSLNPLIQNVPKYKGAKIGYQYLVLNQTKKKFKCRFDKKNI